MASGLSIFSWDDWNIGHLAEHGVTPEETEWIIRHAKSPFPREIGDDKHLVWGETRDGRHLQVIFAYRSNDEVEYESLELADILRLSDEHPTIVYIVHAMDLTPRMTRQYRRH